MIHWNLYFRLWKVCQVSTEALRDKKCLIWVKNVLPGSFLFDADKIKFSYKNFLDKTSSVLLSCFYKCFTAWTLVSSLQDRTGPVSSARSKTVRPDILWVCQLHLDQIKLINTHRWFILYTHQSLWHSHQPQLNMSHNALPCSCALTATRALSFFFSLLFSVCSDFMLPAALCQLRVAPGVDHKTHM